MIILSNKSMCPITFFIFFNPPINIDQSLIALFVVHVVKGCKAFVAWSGTLFIFIHCLHTCTCIKLYELIRILFYIVYIYTVTDQKWVPTFIFPIDFNVKRYFFQLSLQIYYSADFQMVFSSILEKYWNLFILHKNQ